MSSDEAKVAVSSIHAIHLHTYSTGYIGDQLVFFPSQACIPIVSSRQRLSQGHSFPPSSAGEITAKKHHTNQNGPPVVQVTSAPTPNLTPRTLVNPTKYHRHHLSSTSGKKKCIGSLHLVYIAPIVLTIYPVGWYEGGRHWQFTRHVLVVPIHHQVMSVARVAGVNLTLPLVAWVLLALVSVVPVHSCRKLYQTLEIFMLYTSHTIYMKIEQVSEKIEIVVMKPVLLPNSE